ncbi:MAG: glycosyltransferase family 2 protein [Candidatus Saccharimonadales bacterium]
MHLKDSKNDSFREKDEGHTNVPRFSVVMPAYNEENFIEFALTSLLSQSFRDYEIIVVDNASTDRTAEIASNLGVKVIYEPEKGVCKARHTGTVAASGQIIVSTDADNYFDQNWLKRINSRFILDDNIVAVGGSCVYVDAPRWTNIYSKLLFSAVNAIYKLTGKTLYASGANISFYKSHWSGYPSFLTQGGDELYLLKQLRKHGRVAFQADNPVYTSSRRQDRGLIYNLFVTLFFYYFLDYNLSRIFKKSVIGSAPHFNDSKVTERAFFYMISKVSLIKNKFINLRPDRVASLLGDSQIKYKELINTDPKRLARLKKIKDKIMRRGAA